MKNETVILTIKDEDGNQPTCKKCNKGKTYLDFGGKTGYKVVCDNPECRHSFAVVIGTKNV